MSAFYFEMRARKRRCVLKIPQQLRGSDHRVCADMAGRDRVVHLLRQLERAA